MHPAAYTARHAEAAPRGRSRAKTDLLVALGIVAASALSATLMLELHQFGCQAVEDSLLLQFLRSASFAIEFSFDIVRQQISIFCG